MKNDSGIFNKKNNFSILTFFFVILFITSCGRGENFNGKSQVFKSEEAPGVSSDSDFRNGSTSRFENSNLKSTYAKGDSISVGRSSSQRKMMSSKALASNIEMDRLLIKKADLRFKVHNVFRATQEIEKIVFDLGGFITLSEVKSNVNNSSTYKVTKDSSLTLKKVTFTSRMQLRVPEDNLDSCLRQLAPLVHFLDYRTINVEDVTFSELKNNLLQKRTDSFAKRVAKLIDKNPKAENNYKMEESIFNSGLKSDNALIANHKLNDKIHTSSLTIVLYQNPVEETTYFRHDLPRKVYKPGFASRLNDALVEGWKSLLDFILGLASIWEVLLVLGLIGLIVRRYKSFFWNK